MGGACHIADPFASMVLGARWDISRRPPPQLAPITAQVFFFFCFWPPNVAGASGAWLDKVARAIHKMFWRGAQ